MQEQLDEQTIKKKIEKFQKIGFTSQVKIWEELLLECRQAKGEVVVDYLTED